MNNAFSDIKASDELKKDTLQKAKKRKRHVYPYACIAAGLVAVLALTPLAIGQGSKMNNYDAVNRNENGDVADTEYPSKQFYYVEEVSPGLPQATGRPESPEANGPINEMPDEKEQPECYAYKVSGISCAGKLKYHKVTVTASDGTPAQNVKVTLIENDLPVFTGVTDINGIVYLFYNNEGGTYCLKLQYQEKTQTVPFSEKITVDAACGFSGADIVFIGGSPGDVSLFEPYFSGISHTFKTGYTSGDKLYLINADKAPQPTEYTDLWRENAVKLLFTTTPVNNASFLAEMGVRVILIDPDTNGESAATLTGGQVIYTVQDVSDLPESVNDGYQVKKLEIIIKEIINENT